MRTVTIGFILLAMILMVGCGAPAAPAPAAPAPAAPAGAAPKAAAKTIKLGHPLTETSPFQTLAAAFKDSLEKKTGGQMKVDIFPNNTLGDNRVQTQNVQSGVQEAYFTADLSAIIPRMDVFLLPYIVTTRKQVLTLIDSPMGKEIKDEGPKNGIRIIAVGDQGFRQLITRKGPLAKLADLKGLKIRVPETDLYLTLWRALGTAPTPMAIAEVYTSLSSGVIDGLEMPIFSALTAKHFEVAKYAAITNHMYAPIFLFLGDKFYSSLSAEEQKAVNEAAREAEQFQRADILKQEAAAMDQVKKLGVTITEPDLAPFREAVKEPVWKKFESKFTPELIKRVADAADQIK